jgi:hypothetical protein
LHGIRAKNGIGFEPGMAYTLSVFMFGVMISIMDIMITQAAGNNQVEKPTAPSLTTPGNRATGICRFTSFIFFDIISFAIRLLQKLKLVS